MSEITLCVGATGLQGGSVARALLRAGETVHALTRSPRGDAARALRGLGAVVVEGDLSDLASLTSAMRGCTRVFGVTNYWEHFGTEVAHGKNLVDAAGQAGIQHLVLSTLPSPETLSRGAIAVPHMESKAAIEAYARGSKLRVTFVHVAFYYENFLSWFVPRPMPDAALGFGFPQGETPLAGVAIDDVGPVVARIFADPSTFAGDTVGIVGDELTGAGYASALSAALGREVRYAHIACADYAGMPFPGAHDLAAMFDLNRRFITSRANEAARTRALHPRALSFAAWAGQHREQLLGV